MEAQLTKLEFLLENLVVRLSALERDVAVIRSNYATKSDVANAKNRLIIWLVSAILLAQLLPALLEEFGV